MRALTSRGWICLHCGRTAGNGSSSACLHTQICCVAWQLYAACSCDTWARLLAPTGRLRPACAGVGYFVPSLVKVVPNWAPWGQIGHRGLPRLLWWLHSLALAAELNPIVFPDRWAIVPATLTGWLVRQQYGCTAQQGCRACFQINAELAALLMRPTAGQRPQRAASSTA